MRFGRVVLLLFNFSPLGVERSIMSAWPVSLALIVGVTSYRPHEAYSVTNVLFPDYVFTPQQRACLPGGRVMTKEKQRYYYYFIIYLSFVYF